MNFLKKIGIIPPTVGLALGGGAAKGLMHIGVIRYLEEHNIMIQQVAGTSMGSLIGSLYALGKSSTEIAAYFEGLEYSDIVDLDFTTGVIKGKKIMRKMESAFRGVRIEDMEVPLAIVATNLSEGGQKTFRKGSVMAAVRHSISIPGLFAIHHHEDHIFVDGGVVNNLPVSELGTDVIIASSCLGIGGFEKKESSYRGLLRGESVLSFQKRVLARSLRLMMRKIENMEINQSPAKILMVRPRLDEYSPSDFSSLQELIDKGYSHAQEVLGTYFRHNHKKAKKNEKDNTTDNQRDDEQ